MTPLAPGPDRTETTLDGFEAASRRVAVVAGQATTLEVTLTPSRFNEEVIVTARRVEETAQEVPIPVSVVSGDLVARTGSFTSTACRR